MRNWKGRDGLLIRKARKTHTCQGNGSYRADRYSEGCAKIIQPGQEYVECEWDAIPFHTGSAHCLPCAEAFFPAEAVPETVSEAGGR